MIVWKRVAVWLWWGGLVEVVNVAAELAVGLADSTKDWLPVASEAGKALAERD